MKRAAPLVAPGKIVFSSDVIARDELRRSLYWREFMHQIDVDHCAGLVGLADGSSVVIASLNASDRRDPFDAHDRVVLEQLSPHWVNVCRLQRKFGLLRLEAGTLRAALDRLETAVLFLDARGHVCGTNAAADGLLADNALFHLRHACLIPSWHADADPLQQAINTVVCASVHGTAAPMFSLVLRDAQGEPHAVANVQVLQAGSAGPHQMACAAVFIRGLNSTPNHLVSPLIEVAYGLTHAEARFAAAFAIMGDADAAASECGLTAESARSRLKQIFVKTGAHGQTALMNLLGRWKAASASSSP
jgi:hypothetical protein